MINPSLDMVRGGQMVIQIDANQFADGSTVYTTNSTVTILTLPQPRSCVWTTTFSF